MAKGRAVSAETRFRTCSDARRANWDAAGGGATSLASGAGTRGFGPIPSDRALEPFAEVHARTEAEEPFGPR